jgi:hypothetical protein
MSCIIPFPVIRQPVDLASSVPGDVPRLAARLQRIERCESSDEALMETVVDAELAALDALAATQARDDGEVAMKLTALLRRVEANDDAGLASGELALLRGALRDLRRLGRSRLVAQG